MNNALGYLSLTGLFLSLVILLYNKGYRRSNLYLGGYFFFGSFYLLGLCVGIYGTSLFWSALLGGTVLPFNYLIGPFSYLYVRSVLSDNARLSRYDYLHFALFAVEFAGLLPFYLSSWEHKLSIAAIIQSDHWTIPFLPINLIPAKVNFIVRPLQMVIYLALQWNLLWRYRSFTPGFAVPKSQFIITKRWLVVFLSVTTLMIFVTTYISIQHAVYPTRTGFLMHTQPGLIAANVIIILLIIGLLMFPQVMYGLPRITGQPDSGKKSAPPQATGSNELEEINPIKENSNPVITGIPELEIRLERLINEKKPYLDKNFSITTLAVSLDIPMHHLRYYFSRHLKISFATYRNHLRVEYVKILISRDEHKKLSIEGLGKMAGFSSKSTFFAAFREETGKPPLDFIRTFVA